MGEDGGEDGVALLAGCTEDDELGHSDDCIVLEYSLSYLGGIQLISLYLIYNLVWWRPTGSRERRRKGRDRTEIAGDRPELRTLHSIPSPALLTHCFLCFVPLNPLPSLFRKPQPYVPNQNALQCQLVCAHRCLLLPNQRPA